MAARFGSNRHSGHSVPDPRNAEGNSLEVLTEPSPPLRGRGQGEGVFGYCKDLLPGVLANPIRETEGLPTTSPVRAS
jgi:hypothetical protein